MSMEDQLKPGQKFPTPTPGFGDRVFYETLLRQRPDSVMAQEWCLSYGVLPHNEAEQMNKVVTARKKKLRVGGDAAAVVSPKKKKKKKPKLVKDEAADPEMQMGGAEQVGSTVL